MKGLIIYLQLAAMCLIMMIAIVMAVGIVTIEEARPIIAVLGLIIFLPIIINLMINKYKSRKKVHRSISDAVKLANINNLRQDIGRIHREMKQEEGLNYPSFPVQDKEDVKFNGPDFDWGKPADDF